MNKSFHDAWWRLATQRQPRSFSDALACSALATGAALYQGAVALRNAAYDRGWLAQVKLPCRVVSVGNLTVGGTGKTTCVELVARKLQTMGQRVAVLSRGYGGAPRDYWLQADAGRLLLNGEPLASADGLADEPQLLAQRLEGVPVLVGRRRDRTGRLASTRFGAQTVILDDGFQHRRLARDCDIVLIHARMPFGGWRLLPRGPMREPLAALSRAHVLIITKADEALTTLGALEERLRSLNPEAALLTAIHEPAALRDALTGQPMDLRRLEGLRVGLVSSIGDPAGFEATVQRLHATIAWHRAFPDHYRYHPTDWTALGQHPQGLRPEAVVTTEKDWLRLQPVVGAQRPEVPLWVLGVRLKILHGEALLDARLAGLYAR
jgi:tetraacyldisaccharide 4'-kinase